MIVIIDYGLGNLGSVKNALDKLGIVSIISSSAFDIRKARGLILPGVGSASKGMENLKNKNLDKVIMNEVKKGKPLLGLCLGMQLLFSFSEEGNTQCLGIIDGVVKKFKIKLKVPQIGWNNVRSKKQESRSKKLFENIPDNAYFYFVHSYYCQPDNRNVSIGTTNYGKEFCSVIQKDNILGVQFHPEKSGNIGQLFISNWIKNYVN